MPLDKAQRKVAVQTANSCSPVRSGGETAVEGGGAVNVSNLQNIYKFYTKRAKKRNCQAS
jgi:hypothetical protein